MHNRMIDIRGRSLRKIASLAMLSAMLSCGPMAAQAQVGATVTFTPAQLVIEQGKMIDFFGTISNPAGSPSFAPLYEYFTDSSSSQSLAAVITGYDAFGPTNSLPASVDPGMTTAPVDFFTIDTSGLAPDVYTGTMSLSDQAGGTTAPAGFTLTVIPAPEPSALLSLALAASGLGVLTVRARRRQAR